MPDDFLNHIRSTLVEIHDQGLWKTERAITSPQSGTITVQERAMINLCANNYLGLADDARLIKAAKTALDEHGYGMASVRFICGTADLHRALETALADFLGMDDVILFAACFDANGGLFEPLLGAEDAVISDALNHASIIDGIRLCKAKRYRFANSDEDDLERKLKEARANGARHIMIATDGVFSMDGYLANLPDLRALADAYDAWLMVDDCHATGFMGPKGRGTPAHFGIQADIITGTLGKALGGAMGGFIAGPKPAIDLLRQRARPYLFSNALPPSIVAATLEALKIIVDGDALRDRLFANTAHWRSALERAGFETLPGQHPIVPVMTHDAHIAQDMAQRLFDLGVYVSGFFFPVVPQGQARIRTQMNAALSTADLDRAAQAFAQAGKEAGLIP
ncbi:MAG: glycine C-acetyltransferase [Pseudomonadota bacterium]